MSIKVTQDFVETERFAAIQHVRNLLGSDETGRWQYIVVGLDDGRYAVFLLSHLIKAVQDWQGMEPHHSVFGAALDDIPDFLASMAHEPLSLEMGSTQAKRTAIKLPIKVAAVVDELGRLAGVFNPKGTTVRDGSIPAVNHDWLPPVERAMAKMAGGVLSADEAMEAAPAPAMDEMDGAVAVKPTEPRFINVELSDSNFERNVDPLKNPLDKEMLYTLAFFVDSKVSKFSIAGEATIDPAAFAPDEDEIALTVRLESDDFEIPDHIQTMTVGRTGKSKKLKFKKIRPLRDGQVQINAIFLKDGAFIQVMTLRFFVGPLFTQETLGRESFDAPPLVARDVNLTILETVGGFQLVMSGAVGAIATLPLTKKQLQHIIGRAREALLNTVFLNLAGNNLYQTRLDIPEAVNQQVLPKLANVGYDLFDALFFGPGHDMQANLMGEKLREMAQKDALKIRIFSQHFMMPWGLLYVGDNPDAPDPELFLGLKHVIEHIPLQPKMQVTERTIDTSAGFKISLNVNEDIDAEMNLPIISGHRDYWQDLVGKNNRILVEERTDAQGVVDALRDEDTADHVFYFYCHAESHHLNGDASDPGESRLVLTDGEELTLRQLSRIKNSLASAPLVFINACESAKLSPEFYDGFVPFFVSRGARGVIGTEVLTPAKFAAEWSKRFFDRFLQGKQGLGDIFLELRREFYYKHHNVMGLLYALYVDGDTRISDEMV